MRTSEMMDWNGRFFPPVAQKVAGKFSEEAWVRDGIEF
jgi:hypothetical protein